MAKTITRDALKSKMDRGDDFVLLETLAPKSFENGHLPGARNLPLEEVEERAPGLIPHADSEVVVYCASRMCDAADRAARRLESLGYTNVADYVGGKADWKEAGLPLETGEDASLDA